MPLNKTYSEAVREGYLLESLTTGGNGQSNCFLKRVDMRATEMSFIVFNSVAVEEIQEFLFKGTRPNRQRVGTYHPVFFTHADDDFLISSSNLLTVNVRGNVQAIWT